MSLILNDRISRLMKGYPTVSDKYDVKGGILEGDEPLKFGQVIQYGSTTGYYIPASKTSQIKSAESIAGIALATNVKLNLEFGGDKVEILKGEAFNVLVRGFIAVEIVSGLTIKEGDAVYVTADGEFTNVATGNFAMNAKFTGMVEDTLAEIEVK